MKKGSIFKGILLLILITLLCLALTVTIALLAGATKVELFDFRNLNYSNMIPVLIVGGILTCFVILIVGLFLGRTVFFKVKDYFFKNEYEDRRNEK